MLKKIVFMLALAVIIAGCRSNIYYQELAVDRAREFLLKNCEELSSEEINFIRFNTPVLLHAPVFGISTDTRKEGLHSELRQICVAWLMPGREELFMVFGVSGARMDFWEPNRVLIRTYPEHIPAISPPAKIAREYAKNNFYADMDIKDINQVRFWFPTLLRTSFKVNVDPENKLNDEEIAQSLDENLKQIQYSLVWKMSDGRNLVFVGLGRSSLRNWTLLMAEFMDDETLKQNTVDVIITPERGLESLPDKELDRLAGWEE